jgi:hypothetical protein
MIATGPPGKTKRDGHCVTAPKRFEEANDTPLICAAQDHCEHGSTRVEQLANGPHFAKEICTDCGRVLRWLPKPQTVEHQRFNALRLVKLAMDPGLSNWERAFYSRCRATSKAFAKTALLDRLCRHYLEAKPS